MLRLSEPAPGSEMESEHRGQPVSMYASMHFWICSGEPNSTMSNMVSEFWYRMWLQPLARYSSSIMRPSVTLSAGMPPYSSGMPMRPKPISRYASAISSGMFCVSYISLMTSSVKYRSQNSRTLSSRSSCSSVKEKSISSSVHFRTLAGNTRPLGQRIRRPSERMDQQKSRSG